MYNEGSEKGHERGGARPDADGCGGGGAYGNIHKITSYRVVDEQKRNGNVLALDGTVYIDIG